VYRDALRLPAARLLANSRLRVNIAFEIWLLQGVSVDTPNIIKWFNFFCEHFTDKPVAKVPPVSKRLRYRQMAICFVLKVFFVCKIKWIGNNVIDVMLLNKQSIPSKELRKAKRKKKIKKVTRGIRTHSTGIATHQVSTEYLKPPALRKFGARWHT